MFEKLLELLERLVVALESNAISAKTLVDREISIQGDTAPKASPHAEEDKTPEPAPDREAIKKELTELGEDFKNGAKTPTLVKLLTEARVKAKVEGIDTAPAAKVPPAEAPGVFDTPAQEAPPVASAPEVDITSESVRAFARECAAKYGRDKVEAIVNDIGKSTNIKNTAPTLLPAVMAALKALK